MSLAVTERSEQATIDGTKRIMESLTQTCEDGLSEADRELERSLLEDAKRVLVHCGLTEKSPTLETALYQVRRRLRRPSKFRL